jgi:hypothetical protein
MNADPQPCKKKIFFWPLEGFNHGVFVVYKKEKNVL